MAIDTSDSSPPTTPAQVRDGLSTISQESVNYTTTTITANWASSTDADSGISKYWYAIGTTPGGSQTKNWTNNGLLTLIYNASFSLTPGVTYYVSVKAENGAGLQSSTATSSGQVVSYFVDTTPPAAPAQVRDGTGADIQDAMTSNSLTGNWDTSADAESDISGYEYAIGGTPGGADVSGWISVGSNILAITKSGLALSPGSTYYFSIKAVNGAGLKSTATNSNGQYVVLIDTNDITPPTTPAQVRDGMSTTSQTSINYTTTTITANWASSADAESGIAKYWYAICTIPGGNDVKDWTDNGQLTLVFYSGLYLNIGTTYYVRVKAENGVGLQSAVATSAGQYVAVESTSVATPPVTPPIALKPNIHVYPNPYRITSGNQVKFQLNELNGAEVNIYTTSGRLVKKLIAEEGTAAADKFVAWDGKNESGEKVKVGLYVYSIKTRNGDKNTGKLIITK